MQATCHACIGGTNVKEDMKKLEQGSQIVVGTPGRVSDMLTRKAFSKLTFIWKNFYCNLVKNNIF